MGPQLVYRWQFECFVPHPTQNMQNMSMWLELPEKHQLPTNFQAWHVSQELQLFAIWGQEALCLLHQLLGWPDIQAALVQHAGENGRPAGRWLTGDGFEYREAGGKRDF